MFTTTLAAKGRFKLAVVRDGEVREELNCNNLLLDNFFSNTGAGNSSDYLLDHCHVGTGTVEPQFTDTQLTAPLASTLGESNSATLAISYDAPSDTVTLANTALFVFNVGAVVGVLGEVGLGLTTAPNSLRTKALIKDSGGSPVTIPVTADDQLVVTYTIEYKYKGTPDPIVIDVNGTPTTCTMIFGEPAFGNVHNSVVGGLNTTFFNSSYTRCGAVTQTFLSTVVPPVTPIDKFTGSYTAQGGQFLSDIVAKRDRLVDPAAGAMEIDNYMSLNAVQNLSGPIAAFILSRSSGTTNWYQPQNTQMEVRFNPPIPKTSTFALEFGITKRMVRA